MDDWTIILATVGLLVVLLTPDMLLRDGHVELCSMTLPVIYFYKLANAGGGKHVYNVTYWELANHQTMASPAFGLFYVAVSVIKISIVFFYMRLSAFASRTWLWTHRTFIAALIIGAIISLVLTMAQCDPYYSNIREIGRRNTKPKCVSLLNMGIGFSVWHILSDCFLFAVPFIMLWRVQMKFWTKFKVCIAGIIGLANVGLSIARVFVQYTARNQKGGFDLTYTATFTFAYSISELTLGIMTANLPVLSIIATKTVELLSWTSVSSGRSPDRADGGKGSRPKFYKRKIHDESETEFGRLRAGGQPTIRHDVEYVSSEDIEVQQMGPGKFN